jgi:hypothetical protein
LIQGTQDKYDFNSIVSMFRKVLEWLIQLSKHFIG